MKTKKNLCLLISMFIVIISAIYVNKIFTYQDKDIVENLLLDETELILIEEIVDISIENVLIYPNQFDKNSIYIDIEVLNHNGEGNVQIALTNNNFLVASSEILFEKNTSNYFQSFLISENIDFNKDFEISISAISSEKDISNNRYSFKSALKIEKPNIAILTGKLNFNTPFILNNINDNFSHYYPDPLSGNLDITDFWFNKYDIIILDNFPIKPVSDKWLNLFLKKIYSEKSSLIINSRIDSEFISLKNFLPIFGLSIEDENEFKALETFTRFSKDSFKSTLILTNDFYKSKTKNIEVFKETIEWILLDSDIRYSFFLGSKNNTINSPILLYGFSNVMDKEVQILIAEIIKDDQLIETTKLLYNPISGYYFSQLQFDNFGEYLINVKNGVKLVDTINVNLYD